MSKDLEILKYQTLELWFKNFQTLRELQNDNYTKKNTCYVLAYIGRASAVLLCFSDFLFCMQTYSAEHSKRHCVSACKSICICYPTAVNSSVSDSFSCFITSSKIRLVGNK